ncbi:hypothetical protein [Deinococcus sp. QL22]|uniref:hypothetical protein n=1 Tax=Deinococcus sp. QL22 TaxID=2939437 RepID=UPI002016C6F5|nr:hypothetical protein [Deinococcus sp. QL22]UQN10348.1 hypothetical protein M1R55_29800 [Deinococcus sp. QL22]UQN10482.1 hypothetical protein M1R55_29125 [Deinococcus sp. QL22]
MTNIPLILQSDGTYAGTLPNGDTIRLTLSLALAVTAAVVATPAPPPVVTPLPPVVAPEPPVVVVPQPPVVTPPAPPPPVLVPTPPSIPPVRLRPTMPELPKGKVWESAITVKPGDKLEGRYFWNEGEGPCFTLPANTVLPSFDNVVAVSRGPMFSGWRSRLRGKDSSYRMLPPIRAGQPPARFFDLQEFMDIDWHHNDVFGIGQGLFLTGYSEGNPLARQFAGNPSKGDRFRLYRNHLHNPDGRMSDGKGGYIRSLWVSTHENNDRRKAIGGVIGREVSNYLRLGKVLNVPGIVEWNLCTADLGYTVEDGLAFQESSGLSSDPLVVQDNFVVNTGGPDLEYVPGVSKSYNGSNKVISNPTSPQDPRETEYSGTSGLIEGVDNIHARNPHDIVLRRNWGIGFRAIWSQQGGHHCEWDGNRSYLTDRHIEGVPWAGGPSAYFQMTNYERRARLATDNGQAIFDAILFNRNVEFNATAEGPLALPADLKTYGGSGKDNLKRLMVKDGGRAALAEWWALAHANSQSVGRRF